MNVNNLKVTLELYIDWIFVFIQFEMRLNVDQQMKILLTKDEVFWRNILNEYLINVSIFGTESNFKSAKKSTM